MPRSNALWNAHTLAALLFAAGTTCGHAASTGTGQDYPNKPIRIVTGGIGGGADYVARLIAQGITGGMGQQVVVDNRPNGVMPGQIVSRAPADGYTLLVAGSSLWIGPLMGSAPYDPIKDFSPVILATIAPTILVSYPPLPVKSARELIVLAKAKPGELNYFSAATGSSTHLAMELFTAMAGVNIVRVPYKSGAQGLVDLMSGQVQLTFATAGAAGPHIKSGKLRALAITSAKPSVLVPGVPPVATSGLPDYESITMLGVLAPVNTPAMLVTRLNNEIARFLGNRESSLKLLNAGVEAVNSSPEEFALKIKSEMVRMGKVIKDAGIRAE